MKSSDLFETLLNRIGDGVMLVGRDGAIVSANPACAEILGYSQAGLIGLPFSSLVLSEELPLVSADHTRLWADEQIPTRIRRFARKDGTIVTAHVEECVVRNGDRRDPHILAILKDRTGKVEAAATLHDVQQQLRGLIGNTDDAIYLKDASGCYLTINPAGAQMFGRAVIDILFRDDGYLFSDADAAAIRELDLKVIEHGEMLAHEAVYAVNGAPRAFHTIRVPFFDQTGKVTGVLGITRDVTARNALEAALREVDRRYRALIDAHADGMVVVDPGGGILEVSERAARMLGSTKEALTGTALDRLIPVSERPVHEAAIEALMSGSRSERYESVLTRSNGKQLPVEIHAGVLLDADGAPAQFQILFRDLSDRKQVDQERSNLLESLSQRSGHIQTAFEVSSSIASTLDLKNLLSQTVEIIKQRFGYYYVGVFLLDEGEAVLAAGSGSHGKRLLESGHRLPVAPDSMIGWSLVHRRARLAPDSTKDLVRFDNPLLPDTRSELAIPLIVHGEPIGALTLQSDYPAAFSTEDVSVLQIIADQLAIAVQNARLHTRLAVHAGDLEKRVRHRTAQLEVLNKDLEAFSYSISHDLRTPLRAVKGYTEILLDDHAAELSPEVAEYLKKIKAGARRMGALIEDILAFAKLGRQRIRKDRIDPAEPLGEALADWAEEIERRGVQVRIDPLDPVLADRSLLRQVFANLVSNAVKFTRETDAARIHIGEADTARGRAIFVADNGIGFDESAGERLFGVFQRLHPENEYDGSGIGLAIVQRIVERHGGEVWFESTPGEGATFYFCLPESD